MLWAGVAQTDLAAFNGLDLSGFFARQNPSTGLHDPVFARVLALRDEQHLLLIVVMGALGFERHAIAAIRRRITKLLQADHGDSLGQRSLHIMIAATHSHSAPATMTLHGCGDVDEKWLEHCIETAAQTAAKAVGVLQPARFGSGCGTVKGVALNRRNARWTGQVEQAQDTLPLDEQLGVWRVDTLEGAPLACVVNFACHPVVLGPSNREVSAEYPGAVCDALSQQLGAPTLFLTGAAGDINPVRRGTWDDMEWAARQISTEAARVWPLISTSGNIMLQSATQEAHWPFLQLPDRDELQKLQSQYAQQQTAALQQNEARQARLAAVHLGWSEAAIQALTLQEGGSSASPLGHDVELQIFRIGDTALVGIPAEVFVALGLQIKEKLKAHGFSTVFIAAYSNGNCGYLPTRVAYAHGGYEVNQAHRYYGYVACVAPEVGEYLVAQVDAMSRVLS